ncbi:cytochrome P450 [Nocardioides sp. TRM66260-LWL]|uniref:cytochrome P450 n=1 Tax=Nocardioides sp. TRM66260-LWL TaxID=2874478 RepID=UPI001CC333ED|nr:cytochrome P450 [Nocardioides sp. TRM66260-LWL]MBZ5735318.1 cytochrome P450 [Nocardioides sp. TRM66260-LWL]
MTELKDAASPDIQVDFDIHSPDAVEKVYDTYADLRSTCPVAHSTRYGGHFVATRYDDIHDIVRNPSVFSSSQINVPDSIGQDGEMIPIQIDPPDHTVYRRLITPLFSPKRMAALEPQIRDLVVRLLDDMAGRDRVDFIEAFARELPSQVFLALMGWDIADAPRLIEWVDTMVLGVPGASEEESLAAREAAGMEVYAYFAEMIDDREESPRSGEDEDEDITQILMDGTFDGRPLTQFEILNILLLMMIGGLHTVQGQLAHSVIYLAEHPEARQEILDDPDVIPSAVEEMLRYESAICPARKVTQDVVVGDVQLRQGDVILVPFGAANRDPEKFPEPDSVDLRRDPNPHLAFGAGNHRCVGSHLARLELRIAFEELHRRFPHYRLDPSDPPVRHLSQVKGVHRLPLILGESA